MLFRRVHPLTHLRRLAFSLPGRPALPRASSHDHLAFPRARVVQSHSGVVRAGKDEVRIHRRNLARANVVGVVDESSDGGLRGNVPQPHCRVVRAREYLRVGRGGELCDMDRLLVGVESTQNGTRVDVEYLMNAKTQSALQMCLNTWVLERSVRILQTLL